MVISPNADLYSPFQHSMLQEDGPQSSEEGSGLHSPVFESFTPHGDSFRYQPNQLDVRHAAGVLPPQYDYPSPLNVQQPPLIETTLEIPRTSAHHVTFPPHFSVSPRNHIVDFNVPSPANSRLSPPGHVTRHTDFRNYTSSERRLPGQLSHDPIYPRPPTHHHHHTPIKSADQKPPPVVTERLDAPKSNVASGSRERKPISTVVIACRQCRARKIKCDSTRPVCMNCHRRSNQCEYDAVPKRRGPDKRPGTRKRTCKKRPSDGSVPPPPKRKRPADRSPELRDSAPPRSKPRMSSENDSPPLHSLYDPMPQGAQDLHSFPTPMQPPSSQNDPRLTNASGGMIKVLPNDSLSGDFPIPHKQHEPSPTTTRHNPYEFASPYNDRPVYPPHHLTMLSRTAETPSSPTVERNQRVLWENILNAHDIPEIIQSFDFLRTEAGHWLSFLNFDFFQKCLWDPESRLRMQPAFIYAGLALATLMRSSDCEYGPSGRNQALELRSHAQSALETAFNTSARVDASLAEAALILALFELSPHPEHNHEKITAAIVFLDNIIRSISLTNIDAADPEVCHFVPNQVPEVTDGVYHDHIPCSCIPSNPPEAPNGDACWYYSLPWDNAWGPREIEDEECRRLCWNALSLVSRYIVQCAAFNIVPQQLWLTDPSNYKLLFPGEAIDRTTPAYRSSNSLSPKEAIWALYCRSMLLWNFAHRFNISSYDNRVKEETAVAIRHEASSIEQSLDQHNCNLDTHIIYLCREYITKYAARDLPLYPPNLVYYSSNLVVTQLMRSSQGLDSGLASAPGPLVNRKQIDEWVGNQEAVIRRFERSLGHVRPLYGPNAAAFADVQSFGHPVRAHDLIRRPFNSTWFANQLSVCLKLLQYYPNDSISGTARLLGLAKSFLVATDAINAQWPCAYYQTHCDTLRSQLRQACLMARVEPPSPTQLPYPIARSA